MKTEKQWFSPKIIDVSDVGCPPSRDWYRTATAICSNGTTITVSKNIEEIRLIQWLWKRIENNNVSHKEAKELMDIVDDVCSWREFESTID